MPTPDPKAQRPGLVVFNRIGVVEGKQRCTRCKEVKAADLDQFGKKGDGFHSWCRECAREHARQRMRAKRADPDLAPVIREQKLRHSRSPKGKAARRSRTFIDNHVRRQRSLSKPFDWSVDQWEDCVEAWNGCCAYCGDYAPLAQDHFIPLASPEYPGTVAWNMVPACFPCNRSKGPRDPYIWVKSPETLKRIVEYLEQRLLQEIDEIIPTRQSWHEIGDQSDKPAH